ncbi:MAG: ABC transporter ATP-binding protein [Vicinamibacteraceae bacterium]
MTAPLITLIQVSKRFGPHEAVSGVSLEIADGEIVVILGPSGCGKTTLLRLIAGLDVPDEGEIRLAGRCVARGGRSLVAPHERGIGLVFQDLALWPHLTVHEQLDFVLASARLPRRERPRTIQEALTLVRIQALATRYPHVLSGGEQQRVALARALVGRPRVLLLDEPLSSLDADLRASVRADLADLQRTLHVTAIYVTHDREDAAVLADRIVQMRGGRIVDVSGTGRKETRA